MLIIFCKCARRVEPLSVCVIRCCWFCFTCGAQKARVRAAGWSVCISLVGKGRRLRVLTGSFAAANKGHACKPRPQLPPRAAPSALGSLTDEMLLRNTHNIIPSGANVYAREERCANSQMPKVRFFAELAEMCFGFCGGWLPKNCLSALICWSKVSFIFFWVAWAAAVMFADDFAGLQPFTRKRANYFKSYTFANVDQKSLKKSASNKFVVRASKPFIIEVIRFNQIYNNEKILFIWLTSFFFVIQEDGFGNLPPAAFCTVNVFCFQ